jgi:hypothetical protein
MRSPILTTLTTNIDGLSQLRIYNQIERSSI